MFDLDSSLFSKTNNDDDEIDNDEHANDDDSDDGYDSDDDDGDGDEGDSDNDLSFVLAALGPTKSSARSDVCTRPRTFGHRHHYNLHRNHHHFIILIIRHYYFNDTMYLIHTKWFLTILPSSSGFFFNLPTP